MKQYTWSCNTMLKAFSYRPEFVYHTKEQMESYYAKYLGKNWIKEEEKTLADRKRKGIKRTSIIAVNHISFLDEVIILAQKNMKPGFTPAHFTKDIKFANTFLSGI